MDPASTYLLNLLVDEIGKGGPSVPICACHETVNECLQRGIVGALGGAGGSGEPEPGNYPLIPSDRARGVLRDEVVAERKIVYLWNVGQGSSRLEGEACSTLAMSSQRRSGTAPEPSH